MECSASAVWVGEDITFPTSKDTVKAGAEFGQETEMGRERREGSHDKGTRIYLGEPGGADEPVADLCCQSRDILLHRSVLSS